MKTNLSTSSIMVALFALGTLSGNSELFSADEASRNRAVAASPRAVEMFRSLTPLPAGGSSTASRPAEAGIPREVAANRALASTPRMLEEFVVLRPVGAAREGEGLARIRESHGRAHRSGLPVAANPRALEENPALARSASNGGERVLPQIAPLK